MPTLVCVPIMLELPARDDGGTDEAVPGSASDAAGLAGAIDAALADAALAKQKGADIVEFRIDAAFEGAEQGADADELDAYAVAEFQRLLAESPLPVILTCRPTWEGGEYDGDDSDRVALFEKLCCNTDHPPAYLDVELAAYTRSKNLRQKINLCVAHPKQQRRNVSTRLILSTHDFEGRPADLDRKLLAMYDEPACAVVKVAYRARSLRDNLDIFEMIRESPKPIVALGMGEFGLMSRVLAPKFNGFLTFASLRDQAATAPGQPTIDDLLGMYRFRSIGKATKLYGVIGWPVGQSLSPLIHNAGFAEIGRDGVYLPLPIVADEKDAEASDVSFRTTLLELVRNPTLGLAGTSVTIPHKGHLAALVASGDPGVTETNAANTLVVEPDQPEPLEPDQIRWLSYNTDVSAIRSLVNLNAENGPRPVVAVVGAGGVARAAAFAVASAGARVEFFVRNPSKARSVASDLGSLPQFESDAFAVRELPEINEAACDAYINCTPVGMTGAPDDGPWGGGLSIPIADMTNIGPDTVFFDTVYNPVETPMLKAARARGCKTIDGVEMFVKQAAAQFELWAGKPAPIELFDRLCREKLGG